MKNYPKSIIDKIQLAINNNLVKEHRYENYEGFPRAIYANGVMVTLIENEGVHTSINFNDETFDKEECKEWKKEALGRFFSKDWRTSTNLSKYVELTVVVSNVGDVTALCRKIDAEECEDMDYLVDISYNDEPYAVIKAFGPDENYKKGSVLEAKNFTKKLINNYVVYVPETIDGEELEDDCPSMVDAETEQEIQAEPLF